MSELRWDPLRGEWVIVAPHRQERTYHPPPEFCPLCPTRPGGPATEIPAPTFDIVVFENRFPALGPAESARGTSSAKNAKTARSAAASEGDSSGAAASAEDRNHDDLLFAPFAVDDSSGPAELSRTVPARGRCEVVVYTPDHEGSLGSLSTERIERLFRVWADRYRVLSALPETRCVFIFENRGEEIGVTLGHPHGQILSYPFVPPLLRQELDREHAHHEASGRCLHCDVLAAEERGGERVVQRGERVTTYVPFAARWPFEAHLVLRAHRASLLELEPPERRELAAQLRAVLRAYDALFAAPMPYMLVIRQAPAAGDARPASHLRVELYSVRRAPDKLKHRAGSETAMGVFINDVRPEEAAARLREIIAG